MQFLVGLLGLAVLVVGCNQTALGPGPPPGPCNCSDFSTHSAAQACYDYCNQQGYGDVFRLDGDSDWVACESLP